MKDIIDQLEKVVKDGESVLKRQENLLLKQTEAEKSLLHYGNIVYNSQKVAEQTFVALKEQLPRGPIRHEYDLSISAKRFIIIVFVSILVSVIATLYLSNSFDKTTIRNQRIEIEDLRVRLDYLERNSSNRLREQYRKKFDE